MIRQSYYESNRAASEYLLLHYGGPLLRLPRSITDSVLSNFPARCVTDCLDTKRISRKTRALDLGCAVGRASFELARCCKEVIGIDRSESFIAIADELRARGSIRFQCIEEGDITSLLRAVVPRGINRNRVRFEVGDATNLRRDLGQFDVVLMANLIDRLSHPSKCLAQLPRLLKPGGQLILTSPYTWLSEYTPRTHWLGGYLKAGKPFRTLDGLKQILASDFRFESRRDLPFLIREHARKFQLGIADATTWLRR